MLSIAMPAFPAGAGMNRVSLRLWTLWSCVPRRRGDEPEDRAYLESLIGRSPQARG